jgi:ABC-type glycerol-3-phosphate transport system substrate-binding protein
MTLLRWMFTALLLTCAGSAAAQSRVTVGAFTFSVPEAWPKEEAMASAMRAAQFTVSDADGRSAELAFFYFGVGQGGSVEANLARWIDQFQEKPDALDVSVETKEIGGTRVHLFKARGTYLTGMPGGPRTPTPGSTLLAGALESPRGNVFVRLPAPSALADAVEPQFRALLDSPFTAQ